MNSGIPIYILCNRIHEEERYHALLKHLPARGIPLSSVRWISGPWGSELTSSEIFKVYDPFQPRLGFGTALSFKAAALSRGEVSLILTFYKGILQALEETKAKEDRPIIFFESDVVLREDFTTRLADILADPRPWDYISLGEGSGSRPAGSASYFSPSLLYEPPHQYVFRCTDSMLFKRSFLEKLVKTLIPFRECMDWEMNVQLNYHRGIALWADPPLVEPGSGRWRNLSWLVG